MGPVLFAFAAGMVATVNPCGFAMLPAYLSLFLTDGNINGGRSGASIGLRVGAVVTTAFIATFVVAGGVFSYVTTSIVDVIPWAALMIGLLLATTGGWVLSGRHLPVRLVRLRLKPGTSRSSVAVFGVAYAVASISCTLPIFLSVTTAASTAEGLVGGLTVFGAYGLGMGSVLIVLAVAVATSRQTVVTRMRGILPYVERIGGWLLLASGLFIVYYWSALLVTDVPLNSPLMIPLLWVENASTWLTIQVSSQPVIWGSIFLGSVVFIVLAEVRRKRSIPSVEKVPSGS